MKYELQSSVRPGCPSTRSSLVRVPARRPCSKIPIGTLIYFSEQPELSEALRNTRGSRSVISLHTFRAILTRGAGRQTTIQALYRQYLHPFKYVEEQAPGRVDQLIAKVYMYTKDCLETDH